MSDHLRAGIERWIALDPDPATAADARRMLADEPDRAEAAFSGRISFGTAGLRAAMGPGPRAMNRLVVRQTTAGLMRWLTPTSNSTSGEGSHADGPPNVVIGFDARHNSERFARDAAAVVVGAGGRAELLPGPQPTPVLARAVLARGADAGIMITASHNPAADNGYKLYLADGIQLVGPADAEIAAEIDDVAAAMADPSTTVEAAAAVIPIDEEGIVELDDSVRAGHVDDAVAACVGPHRDVQVVYTAMHGVGGSQVLAAFEAAGFPAPTVVADQFEPDPDFPTVAYPNPEEAGALDLAVATAQEQTEAGRPPDAILANDPDADRLAVAVPNRDGTWTRLSGDQVGILLADHLLANTDGADRVVASSLVSSRMISALADASGVTDVRTLTGFKWVARPIVDRPELRFVLGYEEALGYCVGDRVRDKDGISAALVMAELLAETVAAGQTLWDRLDRLAARHGVYLTRPVTLLFDITTWPARGPELMAQARANPPTELAGVELSEVEDLSAGEVLPRTDGVVWHLVDRSRVVIRPSGTEPKLKAYLEVIEPVAEPGGAPTGTEAVAAATGRAEHRLDDLAAAVSARLQD